MVPRAHSAARSRAAKPATEEPAALTRRQEQGEQSRRAILTSAAVLFSRHGYAATPISRLSESCGLPPSSIYWHFGSKEGVLAAVVEHTVEELLADLPRIDQFDGSAIDRFEQMVEVIAGTLERGDAPTRLIVRLTLEEADDEATASQSAVVAALERARELMLGLWRQAMQEILSDRAEDELLVERLAQLGRAVAIGSFVTQRAPHGDLRETLKTFADAVAAVAATRR